MRKPCVTIKHHHRYTHLVLVVVVVVKIYMLQPHLQKSILIVFYLYIDILILYLHSGENLQGLSFQGFNSSNRIYSFVSHFTRTHTVAITKPKTNTLETH